MNRYRSLCSLLVLLAFTAAPVRAAEPELREDYPETYEVVEGDTLWDIAGRFLAEPWHWPEVWEVNPQIDNPHLIFPGDTIRLSFTDDGSPVLTVERGDGNGGGAGSAPTDLPTVRLSPQVRREPFTSPIPSIPLEAINAFLKNNRVIERSALDSAAYLLGNQGRGLLATDRDIVYARGDWPEGISRYDVVRPASSFTDPETGEELGVEAELIGEAVLVSREGDQATLRIEETLREIRMDDRLIPRGSSVIDANYFPEPPDFQVEARILEIGEGLAYGGPNDTLILNMGEEDSLEVGHLLTVQKPDRTIADERAGDEVVFAGEKYGTVLVYRVFEQTSLALVLNSSGPIRMNDRLVTP